MEPKMVKKDAVKIAGFKIKSCTKGGANKREIPKFWEDYLHDGRCEKLHGQPFVKSHAEYGACYSTNMETGEMEYVIGVEAKEGAAIPDTYHVYTLPPALYAVFTTPPADGAGFVSSIQGTWDYIYSEWFPNSGYEFDEDAAVDYELYDERCMKETGKVIDICIPVVKK